MTVLRTYVTQRSIPLMIAMLRLTTLMLLTSACKTSELVSSNSQPVNLESKDFCIASFMGEFQDVSSYTKYLFRNGIESHYLGNRGYFVYIRPSDRVRAIELSKVWRRDHPKSGIELFTELEIPLESVDPGYLGRDGALPPFGYIERTLPALRPTDVGAPAYPGTMTVERGFKHSSKHKTVYAFRCRTTDSPDVVMRTYERALKGAKKSKGPKGIVISNGMYKDCLVQIEVLPSDGRRSCITVIRVEPRVKRLTRSELGGK